ncbi:MAG TPA: polysaccharide deacetylase family protein [Bryobacteraceae bacterium]|nr:polysaccharide deacetylase family protein [Bryobacteraceae bacterium]
MLTRRSLLAGLAQAARPRKALVSITLDLEMARNYPTWDETEWDYEKGNLSPAVKQYAVEAARRVKAKGGIIHFFAVGRVFEQPDIAWLQQIVRTGHLVGNHTYDHINLRSTSLDGIQPRFRRAPWLVEGRRPIDVIAENIRMTSQAIRRRLGVEPAGFRAPGGFPEGLGNHLEVQRMLLEQGFQWASTKYVSHSGIPPYNPNGGLELVREPAPEVFASVLAAQEPSQPSIYRTGLIEVPMCPISDLIAFRTAHWKLDYFLKIIKETVQQAIERRYAYVILLHPACLSVADPQFRVVDLISDLVNEARGQAEIVDLHAVAKTASPH